MSPRPFALLASGILTAAALVAAPMPVATAATTWIYPSATCPITGNHGLQDCVDNASNGDTIELASEIIDELVVVNKSLTVKPTSPTLQPQLTYVAVRDQNVAGFEDVDVTISGLRVTLGVEGFLQYGSIDHVTLRNLVVGQGSTSARGIVFGLSTPVDLVVEGSYIRTTESQQGSLEFYTTYTTGLPSTFRAVGNQLTQHDAPNHNSGSGISVEVSGGARVDAQLHNNQIWDVVGDSAGGASGIFMYPDGPSRLNVDVVGNTLDTIGSNGISLRNNVVAPGRMTLNVFNNIVGHAHGTGLYLDSSTPGTLTFHGGYNDFFANEGPNIYDGEDHGPGNRTDTARYVNRPIGNLSLTSASELIDRGQACTSGGVANLDAAGRGRVAGANMDIGAHERGAGKPTGRVRLGSKGPDTLRGTQGRDILCGFGGHDTLTGKAAGDFLDGGNGRDTACTPVTGDRRRSIERVVRC